MHNFSLILGRRRAPCSGCSRFSGLFQPTDNQRAALALIGCALLPVLEDVLAVAASHLHLVSSLRRHVCPYPNTPFLQQFHYVIAFYPPTLPPACSSAQ